MMPVPVTDPTVLEDIEAEFTLSVYDAARLAEQRRRGQAPPPDPDPRAQALLQRVSRRFPQWEQYAFDPSERPRVGLRSREWTAVARTEVGVLRDGALSAGAGRGNP
jgi:hypothetical protein